MEEKNSWNKLELWRNELEILKSNDLDKVLVDATCYESELRFPTNQKLSDCFIIIFGITLGMYCMELKSNEVFAQNFKKIM